jgi:hypothetical protein
LYDSTSFHAQKKTIFSTLFVHHLGSLGSLESADNTRQHTAPKIRQIRHRCHTAGAETVASGQALSQCYGVGGQQPLACGLALGRVVLAAGQQAEGLLRWLGREGLATKGGAARLRLIQRDVDTVHLKNTFNSLTRLEIDRSWRFSPGLFWSD